MFVLQSHYRNEGNFTFENLTAAKNRLQHWRDVAALRHQTHDTLTDDSEKSVSLLATSRMVIQALDNDLNTPDALRVIDEAFGKFDGKSLRDIHQSGLTQLLETVDETLGLQLLSSTPDISDEAKQLILRRQRAREEKDWATSDKLRDALLNEGINVRDTATGPIWGYVHPESAR
jgi:cysteinyl-tRNA synthetase